MKNIILIISLIFLGCSDEELFKFKYQEIKLLLKQKKWAYVDVELSLSKCNPKLFSEKIYKSKNETIKYRISLDLIDTLRLIAAHKNSVDSIINEKATKKILEALEERLIHLGLCVRKFSIASNQGE